MFGRRNKRPGEQATTEVAEGADATGSDAGASDEPEAAEVPDGPYDSSEVAAAEEDTDGRLDLGSVRLPLLEGAQIQVEMDEVGALRSVHLLTELGRITVAAFAAPRSEGMWRDVVGELADSLQQDGAAVRFEDGPWGREVVGVGDTATMRFVGVDGPRWMVRCVLVGPDETQQPLADVARGVLRDTVVVRGTEPLPVRTPLAVTLPDALAQQLEQVRQQQAQDEGPVV